MDETEEECGTHSLALIKDAW